MTLPERASNRGAGRPSLYLDLVPMDLAFNDVRANLRSMDAALRSRLKASSVPSDQRLFVFPELCLTGFVTRKPPELSLGRDHALDALRGLALEHRTALVAGFPERNPRRPGKPFNTCVLVDPAGGLAAAYRKMHLFTLGDNPESASYSPGAHGVLLAYRGWRIGFSICFDLRFPALFSAYARAGADLILAPSCWVGGPHKSYQFRTLGSAHAILCQAYVACVNRSGRDPAFEYDGSAYVFSPFGEALAGPGPYRLDAAALEAARGLKVRPSDRERYPVEEEGGKIANQSVPGGKKSRLV